MDTDDTDDTDDADIAIEFARDARWSLGTAIGLEQAAARGRLVRVARGAYVDTAAWRELRPEARLRVRARALAALLGGEPVFSHETAAAFLGIPLIGACPERPSLLVGRGGAHSTPWARRVRLVPDGDEVRAAPGVLVTSPARTAIDLAASRSVLGGIVAVSHVRRHDIVGLEALADRVATRGKFPGVRKVRAALARSTDGSDSALESLVVARCQDLGFEEPEQQVIVRTLDGSEFRCDFSWAGGRIVGEADGMFKYEDDAFGQGRTPAEIVRREKRREDAIREVRERFLRLTWGDAWRGNGLERTFLAAGVPRPGGRHALTW